MGAREEQLGQRIRALREARGWSQGELLDQARKHLPAGETFSRVTMSRLENGHQWPRSGTVQAVAAALDVSVDYLLNRKRVAEPAGLRVSTSVPRPEYAQLIWRLNDLPRGVRERVMAIFDDLLDVVDEARKAGSQPEDLGFDLDPADRELDDFLRESGLDGESRSVVWRAIEDRTNNRRLTK